MGPQCIDELECNRLYFNGWKKPQKVASCSQKDFWEEENDLREWSKQECLLWFKDWQCSYNY